MPDFLQSNINLPSFQHLQFIFEKLTILNFNNDLNRVSISAETSICVLCTDRKLLNHREWDGRSKNFNIGKSIVIDGKIEQVEILLETSVGTFKGQLKIDDITNGKPTRRIVQIFRQNDLPAFELQCIILKRPLHFQSETAQSFNKITNAVQTEFIPKFSISTQTEKQLQFREVGVNSINDTVENSTQTNDVTLSTPHQRQIMLRMAVLLINRVHARLLEYQLGQKVTPGNVASKLVNTDFTIPTSLTQNDINNSIRSEHLQGIKQRLQEISKQHRENLMNEQCKPTFNYKLLKRLAKTLTRVKRLCRTGKQVSNKLSPKSKIQEEKLTNALKNVIKKQEIPVEKIEEEKPTNALKNIVKKQEIPISRIEEIPILPEEKENESVKSWISSLHSNASSIKLDNKPEIVQKVESSIKSSSTSLSSSSFESEDSEEDTSEDSQSQSETSDLSESESESEIEEESDVKDVKSSSSIPEEIDKSTDSSIPTEIESRASVSEQSYLESMASTSRSETPTIKKPTVKKLSPTSEYLQKLRTEVTRGRT